jgi:hypothetical protein
MLGVPKELIEHCLKIDPKATLKKHDYDASPLTRGRPS